MKSLTTIFVLTICFHLILVGQNTVFENVYGGSEKVRFLGVDEMQSGDFVLVGFSNVDSLFSVHRYIVKTNSAGDTLWTKKILTPGGAVAQAVKVLPDDSFVTIGLIHTLSTPISIGYFSKFDELGNLLWEHTYDPENYRFNNVIQTEDGGFVLSGYYTDSENELAYNIIKTDASGNRIWSYLIETPDDVLPSAVDVLETQEGAIVLAGTVLELAYQGGYMIKLTPSGDLLWRKNYYDGNRPKRIIQTASNEYLLSGQSKTHNSYLLKVDENGEKLWEYIYGDPQNFAISNDLVQTQNGDIYMSGFISEGTIWDGHLIKTNEMGLLQWESFYGGEYSDRFDKMILTSDLKLLMAGYSNDLQNTVITSGYVVKIDDNISALSIDEKYKSNKLSIQPNPSSGAVTVSFISDIGQVKQIEIYNIDGKLCTANHQIHSDRIEINGLTKGLYFVKIYNSQQAFRSELFIVK